LCIAGLWAEVQQALATSSNTSLVESFRVHVIGKGYPHALSIPTSLTNIIKTHTNLPYGPFYCLICHSAALVPAFNRHAGYTQSKISSSIITSLMTSTPIIMQQQHLLAYSMLSANSVYLRDASEPAVSSVMRVLSSASSVQQDTRMHLAKARGALLHHAMLVLKSLAAADGVSLRELSAT
jgi:hypothetical protein